jgi:hypothetical protein
MSTADFHRFTEALAKPGAELTVALPAVENVTVLGGGVEARAIACQCLSAGANVTLFSAYGAELQPLGAAGAITVRSAGPVGTYQIDQEAVPSIALTSELDAAVAEADVIFVTGPVLKQRTYSMVLAGHLTDGQIVVLAPGRTFGAVEMAWYLRVGGSRADVTIVEPLCLPYWSRLEGNVLHLSEAGPALAGVLPSRNAPVLEALKPYLPNLTPASNIVHSSFADASGFIEIPALLLGGPAMPGGGADLPPGGEPLAERDTFRNMIGDNHRAVMRAQAAERRQVAARWGVRNLPENVEWYNLYAGAEAGNGARPVPSSEQALDMIRCAVIGSLVPFTSAAALAGVQVPVTQSMISLAGTVLGGDLLNAGRRLDGIGLAASQLDDARRTLDAIAEGAD